MAIVNLRKFAYQDDSIRFNNLCCGLMARADGSDATGDRFDLPRGMAVKPMPTM